MEKKTYKKKPKLKSKVGKYFVATKAGKTKTESKLIAGYSPNVSTSLIEESKSFQVLESKYSDEIQSIISKREVAQAHAENIRQEDDLGARNTAIKMFNDITEPNKGEEETKENVIIVIKEGSNQSAIKEEQN